MPRWLMLCAMATALVGCVDTIDTSPVLAKTDTDVAGSFALVSSNGTRLPIVARQTPAEQWLLVADTMVIATSGSWTETARYEVDSLANLSTYTQAGVTTGTWAIANDQINFTTTGSGSATFAGAVTGSTLTIAFNGSQFIYAR